MQVSIKLTREDLIKLVESHLHHCLGDVDYSSGTCIIETKSTQNYRAEWETADFRAEWTGNI